ncbi:hypothetical protein GQ53DRAFT_90771 [Thozetella sp. PMI_491]|nr:hypothetical protein GQ53DRAFT_90771 [Thozetella sp. PMI_491]
MDQDRQEDFERGLDTAGRVEVVPLVPDLANLLDPPADSPDLDSQSRPGTSRSGRTMTSSVNPEPLSHPQAVGSRTSISVLRRPTPLRLAIPEADTPGNSEPVEISTAPNSSEPVPPGLFFSVWWRSWVLEGASILFSLVLFLGE